MHGYMTWWTLMPRSLLTSTEADCLGNGAGSRQRLDGWCLIRTVKGTSPQGCGCLGTSRSGFSGVTVTTRCVRWMTTMTACCGDQSYAELRSGRIETETGSVNPKRCALRPSGT